MGKYFKTEIMFSIISENALNLINQFNLNKFKVASRTVKEDLNLVKKILRKKKLTFISLGMWNKKILPIKNKLIKYLCVIQNIPLIQVT